MEEEALIIDEKSLKHVCVLGKGSYGVVTVNLNLSNKKYYVKKTSLIHRKKNLEKELRIMLRFRNHPRIIQASSSLVHQGKNNHQDCYIYMEYASRRTLQHKVRYNGTPFDVDTIARSTRMILEGLEALHLNGYVHSDLKSANVLIFPSNAYGEPWDIKLADFGLSKEPCDDPKLLYGGTRTYMPPESVNPKRVVGPAFDIWSLGCIVIEMLGGKPIKNGDCYIWRVMNQNISPVMGDFLDQCLALNPLHRASATQLLNHPFITQIVYFQLPSQSQQHVDDPVICTRRVCGPLPTPIGPPKKQKEEKADQTMVPKDPHSIFKHLEKNNDEFSLFAYRLF